MSDIALLSDLDGVLVDSTQAVERAWRSWAAARDVPFDAIEPTMHGVPSRQTIARAAPHLDARRESEAIDVAQAADTDGVVALPGARDLLGGVFGSPVAVVTSGIDRLARSRLAAAGLTPPGVMVTADLIRRGKPHPEGYLNAAEWLATDPGDCIVIEDAPAGVAAGKAAGMTVVAVLTTHAAKELWEADDVIADLRELYRVLPVSR